MGLLLFLLATFRDGNAVRDYRIYVDMYSVVDSHENMGGWVVEYSFFLIAMFVKHVLIDNILFLFAIYALLGIALKFLAVRELTGLIFLSMVIYISNFYILHEFTQIRVGVSSGFMLLCINPINERNFKRFIIFTCCALFFHYSAILLFILWFFRNDRINKYIYILIIPLSFIFYFLQINIISVLIHLIPIDYIQQRYNIYLQKQQEMNVFNPVILAKCVIYYVILWKSKLIEKQNKYVNLLLKFEALSLSSFILFSQIPAFSVRISQFLGIVEIILIPLVYYAFNPKILSKSLVVFIGLCMLLINIFYSKLIV